MDPKTKKIAAIIVTVIIAAAAYYLYLESEKPRYVKNVAGVQVYSRYPLEGLANKTSAIGLHTYSAGAETTCNLELSGVLVAGGAVPDRKGYDIQLERAPQEIFLDRKGAYIRGETDDELLAACHAFICIREGLDCPKNLMEIKNVTQKNRDMVIVLDNRTGRDAVIGFVELEGVLGYLQAQYADTNGDGTLNQTEVSNNKYHIYPYLMNGDTCKLMDFKSAIEELNITNDTAPCEFRSGIFLQKAKTNGIAIDGQKIMITGDDAGIHTGAVIVRDILAPEWIRIFNRANG
ncbi:MAG: hypothetical protein WAX07_07575 [Candidatus Altiarchaeia archaeon]